MPWHALVEIDATGPLPSARLRVSLEAHPLVASASISSPEQAPSGWKRALAGFGRTRAASALLTLEAEDRREAERVARAAVEDALARAGIEARLRVGAFRAG